MNRMIYICSPFRGDYEVNTDNALMYSRKVFKKGYIPITPHIYFPRFADDTNSKERSMAMGAGLQLLLLCSEVWVFGLDHPSEGMQEEIATAIRHNIPVKDGEMMLAAHRRQEPAPALAGDTVQRHVEWLTRHFGPEVASKWLEVNREFTAARMDADQKYEAAILRTEKGAGQDGCSSV